MRWRTVFVPCVITGVMLGACQVSPERECELANDHCDADIAVQCREYDTPTGNGSHFVRTRCPSPDTCKRDAYGAFCTLDPEVDAKCGPGAFCDGNVGVSCRSGYRIAWTNCTACSDDDLGPVCSGGVGHGCTKGCIPGAACVGGLCQAECDCPTGSKCASCDAFGATAGLVWLCEEHRCRPATAKP